MRGNASLKGGEDGRSDPAQAEPDFENPVWVGHYSCAIQGAKNSD